METTMQVEVSATPFEFTGNGAEYFRIWIVNLVLTILTLGIYSAWAKVRHNRYFYGNTRMGVAAFEYELCSKLVYDTQREGGVFLMLDQDHQPFT